MRVGVLLLLFSTVSADPDLWQLLQIWRPTPVRDWHNVTTECGHAMNVFSQALSQRQQWASLMLDATGQIGSQYLQGSDFWFGSQRQCEQVNDDSPNKDGNTNNATLETTTAVYRVLKLKVNVSEPLISPQLTDRLIQFLPRHIWLGVCVPGACGEVSQVSALLRQMLESAKTEQHFRHVELVSVKSFPSEFSVWTLTSTWLLVTLCTLGIGLCIIGTILDIWQSKIKNENFMAWPSILLAFSIPKNARSMFNTKINSDGNLSALHGIRVLSMIWIIICHFIVYFYPFAENPSFRHVAEQNIMYQLLSNGLFSVDAFFFITGVLLSYILLREEEKNKTCSLLQAGNKFVWITVYRILRLTLPYVFIILLTMVTYTQLATSSLFEPSSLDTVTCPTNWWRNILYINNLFPIEEMCVAWGWYLAADTQLYITGAAILLIYVIGYPCVALIVGSILLVSAWIVAASVSYLEDFIPSVENPLGLLTTLYEKPWGHIGPVWVGIGTGWILHRGTFNIGKLGVILGWICCTMLMLVALFAVNFSELFNITTAAIYMALRNTIWCLGLAWILLTCVHKRAGYITDLLEHPIFIPLGRATYCTYLIHLPILEWVFLNLEGPLPMSRGFGVILGWGFVLTSYVFGAIISLLFESPVIQLLGRLRSSYQKHEYKTTDAEPQTIDMLPSTSLTL